MHNQKEVTQHAETNCNTLRYYSRKEVVLSINFKRKQQALYNSFMLNSPGTGYDPSQEFGGNKD